jgi:hypothetical protein
MSIFRYKNNKEMQKIIENGSIFINTYWVKLDYSNVPQCRFFGTKEYKVQEKYKIASKMAQYL